MEFIKQLKCAGGNRNCILQNAESILLQGFLPDLKTHLKTKEKFDVIKLPVQKWLAGPHIETPREGLAGTEWGGGPQGHAFPLYHTETQEDFSSRESCRSGKTAQVATALFHCQQKWQCRNNSACSQPFKPVLRQSSITYFLRKHNVFTLFNRKMRK